jgi:flagellar hook-basal body complex protein FliE
MENYLGGEIMLSIKPELQRLNPLQMFTSDDRHIATGGVAGFEGGRDHGGALADLTPNGRVGQGSAISGLGTATGANVVLRDGSLGAAGLNRPDGAGFSDAMLNAIDKVSGMTNRAEDLQLQSIIDPASVDIHDITLAQAEAQMGLSVATTLLNRLTQAWKDLVNMR